MKREFKVEANIGKPQVAYREKIRSSVVANHKFARQSGGRGQYGHVVVEFSPSDDEGLEFINEIVGGAIPKEYIPAIEKGISEQMKNGVLAGYPLIGLKARLYDGSFHDVDSNEMAFKIAASMCFRDGARKADAKLLEPIMKVEVVTPEEYVGDIVGDLNRRRGMILGMDSNPVGKIVNAEVPLAEMFAYATSLRSMSQGRASYVMEFKHYAATPKNITDQVVKGRGRGDSQEDE